MSRPNNIRVRNTSFAYAHLPHHWFGGSAVATQLGNALNALFPLGERFLLRAAAPHLRALKARDPALHAQVRGFFAQEGRHCAEHERFVRMLEARGYPVAVFQRHFQRVAFRVVEPLAPARLRLATAVAFEHIFSTVSADILTSGALDAHVPAGVRELLGWHAAEEIEHKAVLFDLREQVDGAYAVRVGGMAVAASIWVTFVVLATALFLAWDREATAGKVLRDLRRGPTLGAVKLRRIAGAVLDYLRPGFHPDQRDDYEIAERYFAGAPAGIEAA